MRYFFTMTFIKNFLAFYLSPLLGTWGNMDNSTSPHSPLPIFRFSYACLILLILCTPSLLFADGFRNPFHDAAAIGQGNAFRAQADNPSALFYNQAGMTQLPGIQHSVGLQLISPNTTFRSTSGVVVENSIDGGLVGFPPPGQFFLTGHLGKLNAKYLDRVWVGLGMLNLFGFANEYPSDGPFSVVTTRAQLPLLSIIPSVAIRLTDWLAVGVGGKIFVFAQFLAEGQNESQSIALGNIKGTTAGDKLELNGTGTTAGLDLSLLLTPFRNADGKPIFNVGFIWRSQAVLPLNGALLDNGKKVADATGALRFPESYELGVAYWPLRNAHREFKVEVDVTLVNWSSIQDFNVSLSNGGFIVNPQNWSDAVTIDSGMEYKILNPPSHPNWEYAFRLGYNHSESPIPDANFNPAAPDSFVHGITAGIGGLCTDQGKFFWLFTCGDPGEGFLVRKAIGLDLFTMILLWEPRTVTEAPAITGLNGAYNTITYSGGFTAQINF